MNHTLVLPGDRTPLIGHLKLPGDKSISHRALLLSAVSEGRCLLEGLGPGQDVQRTLELVRALGVEVRGQGGRLEVIGRGFEGLREPEDVIDCGNSGTTARLGLGLLATQPFFACLTGDVSLRQRPMRRVLDPLAAMGAQVAGRAAGSCLPVSIRGGALRGGRFVLPVASAQVKSALLLAGLRAKGGIALQEPGASRDHTERLLGWLGLVVGEEEGWKYLETTSPIRPFNLDIPGDFSSAAFLIVAASLTPGSRLHLLKVGLNPTRTGLLEVLGAMGARVEVRAEETDGPEPVGEISVEASRLTGVEVSEALIPRLIDELPVLCVAAALAEGQTVIRGAREARVKESDRLAVMARGLRAAGIVVEELPDGLVIEGGSPRTPADGFDSAGDHRVAMSWAILSGLLDGGATIRDVSCVDTSFPGFFQTLADARKELGA